MKSRILSLILVTSLVFGFAATLWAADEYEYPVMPAEAWIGWLKAAETAPKAEISEPINSYLSAAEAFNFQTSVDLSGDIDYDPVQRNQGGCGNCWVWAGTGVMEIAHNVQDTVFDRLSIQYLNSCKTDNFACCGGNLGAFATWYAGQGLIPPWDNLNASFADASRGCNDGTLVSCGSISTTPNYPINTITAVTIDTWQQAQATAIANIKNILNQEKGVVFGFALPDSAAWNNFRSFWRCDGGETEATLWQDVDNFCGIDWDGGTGGTAGAHAVVVYGYNDDDPDPANHYWLALNSWGNADGNRPNGFFRIPMLMNYSCYYPWDEDGDGFYDLNIIAFSFETLDVEFGNALPIADANGPYTAQCQGVQTDVKLDGSGSIDLEGALSFAWTSNCPGASFSDANAESPLLTVDTSAGCSVACQVELTVTDIEGATASSSSSVTVSDSIPPVLNLPPDVTIECDQSSEPANTGSATATDACDPAPTVTFSDAVSPGACPQAETITRTWTATDYCGNSSSAVQTIEVVDTTPPVLSMPADITIECDEPSDPSNTGEATATDNCDLEATVSYSDVEIPGDCPQEKTIQRTWTAVDDCGNSSSAMQTIEVVDTTAPVISSNAPGTIIPPDAPISFTATAVDNCDPSPTVAITGYDCYMFTKKGKRIDKTKSCVVKFKGATVKILDSGGVGDFIDWTVSSSDSCGNSSSATYTVNVVNPGKKKN